MREVVTLVLRRSAPGGGLKSMRLTLMRCPGPTSINHGVVGDPQPVFADTTLDSRPLSLFATALRHVPTIGIKTEHDVTQPVTVTVTT